MVREERIPCPAAHLLGNGRHAAWAGDHACARGAARRRAHGPQHAGPRVHLQLYLTGPPTPLRRGRCPYSAQSRRMLRAIGAVSCVGAPARHGLAAPQWSDVAATAGSGSNGNDKRALTSLTQCWLSNGQLGRVPYYRQGKRPHAIAALERYLALDPGAKNAPRIHAAIQDLKRYQWLRITSRPCRGRSRRERRRGAHGERRGPTPKQGTPVAQ